MSKASYDKLESNLALYFERKMALDRLKEKYGLTPRDIAQVGSKAILERVEAYQEELEDLQHQWRTADAAQTAAEQTTQDLEKRGKAR